MAPSVMPPAPPPEDASIPHIDDLLALPTDIDPSADIHVLLQTAELSLKRADHDRICTLPASALRAYIRAYAIAVKSVRYHRDYLDMRKNQPVLIARHNRLLVMLNSRHSTYEEVKAEIIADNDKTRVRPKVVRPPAKPTDKENWSNENGMLDETFIPVEVKAGDTVAQGLNGSAKTPASAKTKPAVHPKPQSLHGNAVQAGQSPTPSRKPESSDLMARIENLRGPRNKGPITSLTNRGHQKPGGPRQMPSERPKPSVDIDTSAAEFPRAPDAIYSPARGSHLAEAAKFPASSSRDPFSRPTPSATAAGTPGALQRQQSTGYFPPPTSSSVTGMSLPSRARANFPEGESVTARDVVRWKKRGDSVLVIDVRSREAFNEGHMMTTSIICIEPAILLRQHISADEISQSLVLAPGNEQELFDKRDQYDLIVYYDQDSERKTQRSKSSDDAVIHALHHALVDYSFGPPLKNPPPRLLQGGLEAWIDIMGSGSLQVVTPASSQRPTAGHAPSTIANRRPKFAPASWKAGEVEQWNQTIHHAEQQTASSPALARTHEDFFRRFPDISSVKESMISSPRPMARPSYGTSHQNDLTSTMPSPPVLPPPALSRPSHSGAAHEQHEQQATATTSGPVALAAPFQYTGLMNPHNWCYSNSTIQTLLASPGFGEELTKTKCLEAYKVPRKPNEKIDNPQLQARILTNLFHWLRIGKFDVMRADTLMNYAKHVCVQSGNGGPVFGGDLQQDADEYFSFLLAQLEDETNVHRHRTAADDQPSTNNQSLQQAAEAYWTSQLASCDSIVDKYWRGVQLDTTRCAECQTDTYRFMPFLSIPLELHGTTKKVLSLDEVLQISYGSGSVIEDFACNTCTKKHGNAKYQTKAVTTSRFPRMPELLRVSFKCYTSATSTKKNFKIIDWDPDNVDLSMLRLPSDGTAQTGVSSSSKYQCYAIILHKGPSINGGHYICYVRDRRSRRGSSVWIRCNDNIVKPMHFTGPGNDVDKDRKESFMPYMAFFERKS